jgi:peptidyl-prolyl cis-trans isomerase C
MLVRIGKMAIAIAAVVALTAPALAQAAEVAAVVNGDKISQTQVQNLMKQNNVKPDDESKVYPIAVDQLVDEQLLASAAKKSGVQSSSEYKKRLGELEQNLTRQVYVDNYLKDKVTDAAVKGEYDKLKAANKGKEEVHARHILVKTEEEAKKVITDLDNGAKFEDLAKERSIDPSAKSGGDIGYFVQGELVPEFSDAAFATKPGTYTKTPVHTKFGWHVIYVVDKRPRVIPELKDVQDRIRGALAQQALKGLIQSLAAKADIKRYDQNGKPMAAAPAATAAPAAQ